MSQISELIGKILTKVEGKVGCDQITFTTENGAYLMHHSQSCCEDVTVEDICGDWADLLGSPIVQAEESESNSWPEEVAALEYADISFTWTFYRLTTIKGSVVIRWYGYSNGYYSESVDFNRVVA